MNDQPVINKRKFKRIDLQTKIVFSIQEELKRDPESEQEQEQEKENEVPKQPTIYTGTTRNVSMKGVCFRSEQTLRPGTLLNMEIYLPSMKNAFHLEGQVRWSRLVTIGDQDSCEVGVSIFLIDRRTVNKFVDFIQAR